MDFAQSQTKINLARAFAGESQARNRYTIYANQARKQDQEYLARIFEETADNERVHAEEFLELLQKHGSAVQPNIDITAGYPFTLGTLEENLQAAAEGELEEETKAYPAFAEIAEREGFKDAARLFRLIATIEGVHHNLFSQALEQLKSGTLFQKKEPITWRCLNCGYTYTAENALNPCPVCKKSGQWAEGNLDRKNLS